MSDKVRYSVSDGVATIALDDPETRNSLSNELLQDAIDAFERARDDADVRCVVLASSHEKVFSSGGNLAGFAADVPLVHRHFGTEKFVGLFRLIGELGKPTICAARGHVLAGALGVALACDLIVASDQATFGTPEINVGVFPFMIMALIYRNVPRKKTNELLLLGERIDAREAERLGIVNKVVSAGEFDDAVRDWATKLAAKSPVLMRMGKDAIFRQQDMAFVEALDFLRSQLTIAMSTEDIVEGVQAFFEKREPEGKGPGARGGAARRPARRARRAGPRRWRASSATSSASRRAWSARSPSRGPRGGLKTCVTRPAACLKRGTRSTTGSTPATSRSSPPATARSR